MNSDEKPTLRLRVREKLRRMAPEERAALSSRIATHLRSRLQGRVFGFAPLRSEPDWLIAGWSGALALPRVEGNRLAFHAVTALDGLTRGAFGIREPAPDAAMAMFPGPGDVILVPGMAFDPAGGRLGRGGGFYDRFLARWSQAHRVGVAFAAQLVNEVPREDHDALVDSVVTEEGWIDAQNNRFDRG